MSVEKATRGQFLQRGRCKTLFFHSEFCKEKKVEEKTNFQNFQHIHSKVSTSRCESRAIRKSLLLLLNRQEQNVSAKSLFLFVRGMPISGKTDRILHFCLSVSQIMNICCFSDTDLILPISHKAYA